MRLALACGEWDIRSFMRKLDAWTLSQWAAFYAREPFGEDWRRSGRLAAMLAAMHGAKTSGDLEDLFMPGGGKYRGMNAAEIAMHDELKKIPQLAKKLG